MPTGLSVANCRSCNAFVTTTGELAGGRAWPMLPIAARFARSKPATPRDRRKRVEHMAPRLAKMKAICTLFGVQNTLKIRHRCSGVMGAYAFLSPEFLLRHRAVLGSFLK